MHCCGVVQWGFVVSHAWGLLAFGDDWEELWENAAVDGQQDCEFWAEEVISGWFGVRGGG